MIKTIVKNTLLITQLGEVAGNSGLITSVGMSKDTGAIYGVAASSDEAIPVGSKVGLKFCNDLLQEAFTVGHDNPYRLKPGKYYKVDSGLVTFYYPPTTITPTTK